MNFNEIIEGNDIDKEYVDGIDHLVRDPRPLVRTIPSDEITPEIVRMLADNKIRRGNLVDYSVTSELELDILRFVNGNKPIEFVFQAFPFKCHNPVETLRRTPDLGELSFLLRLGDIDATIKQVYSPGVKFTVLTEGKTYQDLFGASSEEVMVFDEKCDLFCQKLELNGVINFVDFMDIVPDQSGFRELIRMEENKLRSSRSSKEISEMIESLSPVMMRSLAIMEEIPIKDLLVVFGFGNRTLNDLTGFQLSTLQYLSNEALEVTIKYLAIQSVKKNLNMVKSTFPESIYVSTISRQGIYSFHPIHRRTRLYPHHGVPVLGSDKTDIEFVGYILSKSDQYTAVYVKDDIEDAPFYFLKGTKHVKQWSV